MGGTQSVSVPGGGTEGYHILKVILFNKQGLCQCLFLKQVI